jgi:hypothetical protein
VIEPLDQDTGKGKQREGSEDKGTSIFDLEFEREVWRDHGLFEVTETKEMGIRESFEEEQGSKSTVEERETLVDAITQLTVTLEQMGQRVGNTPPACVFLLPCYRTGFHAWVASRPPAAADAQKRQTLRHRIMSTFKEKKDQLKPKSPTSP